MGARTRTGSRRRAGTTVLLRVVGLLVALVTIAAGCSSASTPTAGPAGSVGTTAPPAPRPGGHLTVATGGDADGYNPMKSQWSGSATQVARAVLDPLVVMDRENRWQPYLVKAITPNADFTVWTFSLRDGVKFHNGEAFDADALKLFFEAVTTSPLSSQGFPEKPTVTRVDDKTVTLTFTQPWSQMPAVLADQPGYVIAPAQIQSGDDKHPIGTGPFVFEEWTPGKSFKAKKNPSYWRTGLPYLDEIEFRPITDKATRVNALKAQNVDVIEMGTTGKPAFDELAADGYGVVDDVDNVGVMNLLMNTQRGALADLRVREAIVRAIDRQAFRDAVLDDSFEVADQPYPSASRWHADDVGFPTYDPEQAKKLVDEHVASDGPVAITIMVVAGTPTAAVEFIQQQLQAVGIEVKVDTVELVKFIQQFIAGTFDATYMGQFLSAADPDGTYPFLIGKNAAPETPIKLNFSRLRSDVIDQALTAQRHTGVESERKAEFAKVWKELATQLPYAFLAYDKLGFATAADVHGLTGYSTPEGVALPAINHWTPFWTAAYRASA